MKKITTMFLGTIITLTFSLFLFGCAEHKVTQDTMGSKVETMHKDGSVMGDMNTTNKQIGNH
jgi:hypothetical protein